MMQCFSTFFIITTNRPYLSIYAKFCRFFTIESKTHGKMGHQTYHILQRNVWQEAKGWHGSKHFFEKIVKFGKSHIFMRLQQIAIKLPVFYEIQQG